MVCNETFLALSVHNQDFETNNIIMAYTTFHDLILKKIHMLIIVHLKKCPCEMNCNSVLPSKSLFP
jgi:hypothetical protein